jgi:hypothetical protein
MISGPIRGKEERTAKRHKFAPKFSMPFENIETFYTNVP